MLLSRNFDGPVKKIEAWDEYPWWSKVLEVAWPQPLQPSGQPTGFVEITQSNISTELTLTQHQGANIMLLVGGIAFQLGSSIILMIAFENIAYLIQPAGIILYSVLDVEYYLRYQEQSPIGDRNKENGVQPRGEYTGNLKLMLMTYTLAFSMTLLFIRQIISSCRFYDLRQFKGNIPYDQALGRLEWKNYQ